MLLLTMGGGYAFAVMFPAVVGPMVSRRIASGSWMLTFAALGTALVRSGENR